MAGFGLPLQHKKQNRPEVRAKTSFELKQEELERLAKIEHAEKQRLGEGGDWRKKAYEKLMRITQGEKEEGGDEEKEGDGDEKTAAAAGGGGSRRKKGRPANPPERYCVVLSLAEAETLRRFVQQDSQLLSPSSKTKVALSTREGLWLTRSVCLPVCLAYLPACLPAYLNGCARDARGVVGMSFGV